MSGELWLMEYDACEMLGHDAMEKILTRNRSPKGSTAYTKQTAHARTLIQQFSAKLNKLRDDLIRATVQHRLVGRECDRRQAMLDQLVTKEKQLETAFRNDDTSQHAHRSALVGDARAFATDPWSSQEVAANSDLTVDEIRQQQQQAIQEQDKGLDTLSQVLSRQKQMAVDIGNEVDCQDELIDDITDHTDRASHRLLRETKHIKIVDRKSNTCYMWVIVVLLLIAIVVVCVVPNGK